MNNFVQAVQNHWVFGLLSILSTIFGVIAGFVAICGAIVIYIKVVWRYSN